MDIKEFFDEVENKHKEMKQAFADLNEKYNKCREFEKVAIAQGFKLNDAQKAEEERLTQDYFEALEHFNDVRDKPVKPKF